MFEIRARRLGLNPCLPTLGALISASVITAPALCARLQVGHAPVDYAVACAACDSLRRAFSTALNKNLSGLLGNADMPSSFARSV